jgi:hypothetical protein
MRQRYSGHNGNIVKGLRAAVRRSCLQPLLSTHAANSRTEHKEISPYFEPQHTAVGAGKPETCTLYLPLDDAEETRSSWGDDLKKCSTDMF